MRTQMLWYFAYRLEKEGRLPQMMLHSSSPTADLVGKIMLNYLPDMDERGQREFANPNDNPFHFNKLVRHKKMEQTINLLTSGQAPYGIIASSGMCDYGRIVTILRYTLADPKNIILQTGYASPGTRMWMMEKGHTQIPFYDSVGMVDRKAEVRRMGGLSGHADVRENIAHLKHLHDPEKGEQFKGIYIKHGEKSACEALRNAIVEEGFDPLTVHVMKKGEAYTL